MIELIGLLAHFLFSGQGGGGVAEKSKSKFEKSVQLVGCVGPFPSRRAAQHSGFRKLLV